MSAVSSETNIKKLKLIKMITESDDIGIEKICSKLFDDKSTEIISTDLTAKKLIEQFAEIFTEVCMRRPDLIIHIDEFAFCASEVCKKLNLKGGK